MPTILKLLSFSKRSHIHIAFYLIQRRGGIMISLDLRFFSFHLSYRFYTQTNKHTFERTTPKLLTIMALDAEGLDLEIDLSNLGTVNTVFAALFSKLGVPIKTTVSANVLEEALSGTVTIRPLPLGTSVSGKVEKQCAHFFGVTINEKQAQSGIVVRFTSAAQSKFKSKERTKKKELMALSLFPFDMHASSPMNIHVIFSCCTLSKMRTGDMAWPCSVILPSDVAKTIRLTLQQRQNAEGHKWKSLPPATVDFYWNEFQMHYTWDPDYEGLVYK